MRDFGLFLRSCATVYRRLIIYDIQHIETIFENFLIRRRITPEFITFFVKVLEKLLEKLDLMKMKFMPYSRINVGLWLLYFYGTM